MNLPINYANKLVLLNDTLYFFRKHFITITGLALIAAFGRVVQLGGFGPITPWMHLLLEIVVESARILLFLFVLGFSNIVTGVLRIKNILTRRENRRKLVSTSIHKMKKQWSVILINITGLLFMACTINYAIDLLAYQTCLYLTLKDHQILSAASSEWTILLFFKNLTVIPLTLIFESVLILWLANKLPGLKKPTLV